MSFSSALYTTIFKRNSVFVPTVFLAAFGFTMGFDIATTKWWDQHNYPKQWKDIRQKYVEADEEE